MESHLALTMDAKYFDEIIAEENFLGVQPNHIFPTENIDILTIKSPDNFMLQKLISNSFVLKLATSPLPIPIQDEIQKMDLNIVVDAVLHGNLILVA